MSIEENKAIACQFEVEHPTDRYAEVADHLLAPDASIHFVFPGTPDSLDRDGWKQLVVAFRTGFTNMRHRVEDVIAEGDLVTVRWSGDGTNTGELQGIPATGKFVTTSGITMYRITDGKIRETWHIWDSLGILQQLGVVPTPESAQI